MTRTGRPNLGKTIKAVMRDAARRLPEFAHIDASRILIVAGEARRASRATVRPMCFADSRTRFSLDGKRAKPIVQLRGTQMLYVVAFRPRFFMRSTPEQRVETILHELWHMAQEFDGTLHRARRHAVLPGQRFHDVFQPLVKRYLSAVPPKLLAALAFHGEGIMRHWLERPAPFFHVDGRNPSKPARRPIFTEAQLFYGPVKMITPDAWRH
ncbi:putative metallopeptidase [Vulgatibacter incomptus]|nr:putative metallopeptidase [Vulgatibacter incomptus]